jgi:hypothetical protein
MTSSIRCLTWTGSGSVIAGIIEVADFIGNRDVSMVQPVRASRVLQRKRVFCFSELGTVFFGDENFGIAAESNRFIQRQVREPSPPFSPDCLELNYEFFWRGLLHVRFRRAHKLRGLTKSEQFLVVHPAKPGAQRFYVEFYCLDAFHRVAPSFGRAGCSNTSTRSSNLDTPSTFE